MNFEPKKMNVWEGERESRNQHLIFNGEKVLYFYYSQFQSTIFNQNSYLSEMGQKECYREQKKS